jgi:hypothetical protein
MDGCLFNFFSQIFQKLRFNMKNIFIRLIFLLVGMTTAVAQDISVSTTQPSAKTAAKEPIDPIFNRQKGLTGGLFFGTVVPTGSYSEVYLTKDGQAGGADIGYSIGLQLGYRYAQNVSFICEVQVISNKYNLLYSDDKNTFNLIGNWFHYSLMPGFNIDVPLAKKAHFYAGGSAGILFSSLSGDFEEILKSEDTPSNSKSLSTGVRCGFILEDHINIGLKYNISTPKFSDYKASLSFMQLVVGFDF